MPICLPRPLRWRLLAAGCLLLSSFILHPSSFSSPAPRNPLTPTAAPSADDRSATIRTEADHLANVHDGAFALYRALDFDSGVAAVRATVAGPRPGALELRLDSPTGPLLATCPFTASGGWDQWQDITANVDHSQAGVRDVYVLFRAPSGETPTPLALVNLRSFVFLKSVVTPSQGGPDLASRLDSPDANEPQSDITWGIPQNGFRIDAPAQDWLGADGMGRDPSIPDSPSYTTTDGTKPLFAYTPEAYLNRVDIGGEWRLFAQGSLTAYIIADALSARPGLGFTSGDGKQAVYVTFNPEHRILEAWRKLADGTATLIHRHPIPPADAPANSQPRSYKLRVEWSPYANALIARLYGDNDRPVTDFRTVIDLPAARHPLLVNTGGAASFRDINFSPTIDAGWQYRWEWLKQPVLTPDVCNPAVWRGPDGRTMFMMWRKFGADNFHGIAKSDDGLHWTRVTDEAIKCTGDMTVLADPFGDGKWYATPGGNNLPWCTSDGSDDFKTWTQTTKTVGDIHGHNRIQEIIDTKKYPQLKPVHFQDQDYRFIAYCEDWVHAPQPHSVVLLSNTLTDWVQPSPDPVVPPSTDFWGEKGNAIGSAIPLPDGNLLLSVCACTNAGYTGAPEPTNVTAIASGTEPWKILKKATLPDAPVSRENVWYQGPNFGTALFYDDRTDTLFYYGGFHDYHIGVMRVRNFLQGRDGSPSRP